MKVSFEQMFQIPVTAMRINRSHPEVPRNTKWLVQFVCMHTPFTVTFSVMFYNILLNIDIGNFSYACRNGVLAVIFFVISVQYLTLVIHQKNIAKIIEIMKADFDRDMPEDEQDIVFEYAKKGNNFCKIWVLLCGYTGAIFPIQHLILELKAYITVEWQLLQVFPLTYPSPIEEHKFDFVVFCILYILVIHYTFYAVNMYAAFVPLGPCFMLHACGQLEIVKKRTLALYVDTSSDEVEQKLKVIVKHLQYIYGFVEYIKESFKVLYELAFKFSTIFLPVTVYTLLETYKNGEFSLDFISFIFSGLMFIAAPCYYGDLLMDKGEEVRQALYSCGWEKRYDHGVRTTLIVMLLRALQPVVIRTMFTTVSLDALADVLHQSYSLFNLMNAALS